MVNVRQQECAKPNLYAFHVPTSARLNACRTNAENEPMSTENYAETRLQVFAFPTDRKRPHERNQHTRCQPRPFEETP